MNNLVVLIAFFGTVSFGAPQRGFLNADSPPYTVTQTFTSDGNSFEERLYEGGKNWVCNKRVINNEDDSRGMFMMLFYYISGANVGNQEIQMTSPVSTKWTMIDGTFEKEMCFYLDDVHQANPPQPTNPEVYIVNRPEMTVYTRKVGGYMNDDDWRQESDIMDAMLASNNLKADNQVYYVNGYNSPMEVQNRRNELWKIKV